MPNNPTDVIQDELRPEVLAFARLMEFQLRANDHKPGWKDDDWRDLMGRLEDERRELHDCIARADRYPIAHAGREAADVANFAMMIADVCGALEPDSTALQSAQHRQEEVEMREARSWQSVSTAPKDGTVVELVVDYSGEDADHALQDAIIAPTIGFNNLDNDGEDEWKFAGWCWSHDHFTEGRGEVIAWRPSRLNANGDDGSLEPLPARAALERNQTDGGECG